MACFVPGGMFAESSEQSQAVEGGLDHLIPPEKWAGTGLNKLTISEQQALASEIAALLRAAQTTQHENPAEKDRSQWRMLQRGMPKDEVKKLLGEPVRISVSRFYEFWDYLGGSVTFDGKGRVDSWSEP
jgi:hypothetical protein